MGIWALGYDDGYLELWNEIETYLTDCYEQPCSGTFHDIGGGPYKNYYDDENYTFTIAPPNAVSLDVSFSSFDVEQGFDYLYVYDGSDANAPQISGSPFTGTTVPPNFTTSTGAVTFKFISDGSTVAGGFEGTYTCNTDLLAPTTVIDPGNANTWQTDDFIQAFTDEDDANGTGVHKSYYHVGYLDNGNWTANEQRGFFNDNFDDQTMTPQWEAVNGTWTETATGELVQTDETLGNTNTWASLNQSLSNHHVYHWKGRMSGGGTNRRAGLHIFCDDSTATNRGNSYFVWFRLDDDKVQFYKSTNDVFGAPVLDNSFDFQENVWYDFKLIYDRIAGDVWVYVDDELVGQWTDSSPIATGEYISFRSGNSVYEVDDLTVYRSRYPSVTINVGPGSNDDMRTQNPSPADPAGRVLSIVKDNADNLSAIDEVKNDIDWSAPHQYFLNDGDIQGVDEDTIFNNMVLQAHAHWSAIDTHSLVVEHQYAIGSQPNLDDIVSWTSASLDTSVVNVSSGNFVSGEWYYFSLRSLNGAGLMDTIVSDGFRLVPSAGLNDEELSIPLMFPNPTQDIVTLFSDKKIENITVYDLNGKAVIQEITNENKVTLNTQALSAGVYSVRIVQRDQVIDLKLVKE